MEMKCFRSICSVTRIHRNSNEEIRRRVGMQNKVLGRVENCVLRWFGYVERMDDERMKKRVHDSGVQGETNESLDGSSEGNWY